MAMKLYLLHGFLGRPDDWNGFSWPEGVEPVAVDIFADPQLNERDSLDAWAVRFAETAEPGFLVGYSLGGRLALHAMLARPERWKGVVLVSTHPGLTTDAERALRLENDACWAHRFREEPWQQVLDAWRERSVFGGSAFPATRSEAHFSRHKLAAALDAWSLGRQKDLREAIARCPTPNWWIAGERDTKFTSLVQNYQAFLVPGAGHRVPWERKEAFEGAVKFALKARVS